MKRAIALTLLAALLTGLASGRSGREPKRLAPRQLEQLADVLFRRRQYANVIRFRYVIAYSELSESQAIDVVIEPFDRHDVRILEVFTFTGKKCMHFVEENFGPVKYDQGGQAYPTEVYYGGVPAFDAYGKAIANIRSTPLFIFRRKDVPRTCATFNLLMDSAIEDYQRREAEAEKAKRKARKP